jgi:hypothetical protein
MRSAQARANGMGTHIAGQDQHIGAWRGLRNKAGVDLKVQVGQQLDLHGLMKEGLAPSPGSGA